MTQGNIVNDMEKIIEFSSKTVVLSVNDIDTDQIIPARFLTVTTKDGLGDGLFADWRFDEDGNKVEQFPRWCKKNVFIAFRVAGELSQTYDALGTDRSSCGNRNHGFTLSVGRLAYYR